MQYICCTNTVTYRVKLNKMSDIAIASLEKSIPDDLKAYINGLVDMKVEKAVQRHKVGGGFVTRTEIVLETSRRMYDYGVRKKLLNPIAIEGTNAQHYVFRTEYEAFLRHLQIKRNS